MSEKQVRVPKPDKVKMPPTKPAPIKPQPVTPQKAEGHSSHCIRCGVPPTTDVVQVRACCMPCSIQLGTMHASSEYVMFRRAYYIPSTEGTSLDWLLNNGYGREVQLPPGPRLKVKDQARTQMVQAQAP